MNDTSPSTSSPPPGGVSRFVGVGLSLIIGLVTFTVGVSLFPVELPRPPAPPARAPVAAPPAAPSPPPSSTSDAGGDSVRSTDGAADGGDGGAGGGSGSQEGNKEGNKEGQKERHTDAAVPTGTAVPPAAPAPRRPKTSRDKEDKEKDTPDASAAEDATTGAGGESGATIASGDDADGGTPAPPAADCTLSDKDIAREAWRHNWPTICPIPASGKAFIIIPVKGSIENAVAELKRKPVREARVTVPTGESLLTLKVYKLRRLGFKDLKIGPADDGTGTRFRVRLMNGAGDPVFDVKDGYAKITVTAPPE
jgi:hypothetical protein